MRGRTAVKKKTGVLILVPLLLGLFLLAHQLRASAAPLKLNQVVYLTLSQACGCILDRCKAGD